LEGKGGEGFGKKEGGRGINRVHWKGRALGGYFFFIIPNTHNLEELKSCIEGGFQGFWRVNW